MRHISRALAVLAVGGALAVSGTSPALAAPCEVDGYAFSDCIIVTPDAVGISADVLVVGETVFVKVSGFKPGSEVIFAIRSTPRVLGTFTADSTGTVETNLEIPADMTPGSHTITAQGIGADGAARFVRVPVTVVTAGNTGGQPVGAPGGGLPITGDNTGALALGGMVLLAAGGALVVVQRRRASVAASAA